MLELGVRTAEQLAGELGVSSWSLKRWAKVYGQDSVADGPPGSDGPSVADAAALTLENARLRRQQDEELAEQIALIFLQSRRTYGSRRIQQVLRRGGIYCGKNRICRLMDGPRS
jgi:transposase-like protein